MKLIGYVGIEESVMVIEKETDLYPALDHIHTTMVDLGEAGNEAAYKCANFIFKLMEMTEKEGFGNSEDVDNIEWS